MHEINRKEGVGRIDADDQVNRLNSCLSPISIIKKEIPTFKYPTLGNDLLQEPLIPKHPLTPIPISKIKKPNGYSL